MSRRRPLPLTLLLAMSAAACGGNEPSPAPAPLPVAQLETSAPCAYAWETLPNQPVLALANDVVYRALRFQWPDDDTALLVHGTYPDARYVSFTTYRPDDDAFDSVYDAQMTSSAGAYDVAILPDGVSTATPLAPATLLRRPLGSADGVAKNGTTLWYRVYVPYGGIDAETAQPAPSVYAFRASTLAPAACPTLATPSTPLDLRAASNLTALPAQRAGGTIDTFRTAAHYIYQNPQNGYLTARVSLASASDVAVVRFRYPSISTTYSVAHPDGSWAAADARYVSLFAVDGAGQTIAGVHDSQLAVAKDAETGLDVATIVIGDAADPQLPGLAASAHATLLAVDAKKNGSFSIVYRQQAANAKRADGTPFEGNVANLVPICDARTGQTADQCAASCYVGAYAPRARVCSKADWASGACAVSLAPRAGCQQLTGP